MAAALLFTIGLIAVSAISILLISGTAAKFIIGFHSAGVTLMLGIPSIWHALMDYQKIGFLGNQFSANSIAEVTPIILLIVFSVHLVTCFLAVTISKAIGNFSEHCINPELIAPRARSLLILLFLCLFFFLQYYGDLGAVLALRSRESVELPIYFELLRGSLIGICTYSTALLTIGRSKLTRTNLILSITVFFVSFILLIGFGSRNLLVYPLAVVIISLTRTGRNASPPQYLVVSGILVLLLLASLLQSIFRDSGLSSGSILEGDVSKLVLAFDQFDALTLAYLTKDISSSHIERWTFAVSTDIFTYFLPRSAFEILGLEKLTHTNYLAWNDALTYPIISNITPSYIGQALIENGYIGIVSLPFTIAAIFGTILTAQKKTRSINCDQILGLTFVALASGALFNSIRILSGNHFLYIIVFFIAIYSRDLLRRIVRATINIK